MSLCRKCLSQAHIDGRKNTILKKNEGVLKGEICDRCGFIGGML